MLVESVDSTINATKDDGVPTNADVPVVDQNNETSATDKTSTIDQRVVMYRTIVGNSLTYEPLDKLIKLGYTVPELERIKSESLCVIVSDQIRNPRMGVPLQWCVKNRAEPQVQIVDSPEEAQKVIDDDDLSQRENRRQKREDKQSSKESSTEPVMSEETESTRVVEGDYMTSNGRRRPSKTRIDENDETISDEGSRGRKRRARKPNPLSEPSEVMKSDGSVNGRSWRNGKEEASDPKRRRRRKGLQDEEGRPPRERSTDGDDDKADSRSRRRVYNARDIYSGSIEKVSFDRGDPPHPNSPLWFDYDTFKKLLRWEARFRMFFVGENIYDDIKKESDWRLGLYKSWLWRLHDGVGEGIVPRSRYERARRMRMKRGIINPDDVSGDQMTVDSVRASSPRRSTRRGKKSTSSSSRRQRRR